MMKRVLLLLSGYLFAGYGVWAQAPVRSNGEVAPIVTPANNSNVVISPGANLFESQTGYAISKDVFDVDSDSIDFAEGAFNWKGRTFNLGDSRIARARFERYLATPEISDDYKHYMETLGEIADLLSLVDDQAVKDPNALKEQIYKAWQLLFVAGKYEIDGGASLVIANQVYNVWRVRDENYDLEQAKGLLEDEIEGHQDYLVSDGWNREKKFDQIQRQKASERHTGNLFDGVTESTFEAERMVEKQARLAALSTRSEANGIQVKLQFQTHVLNLLLQRRFEHCIIASAFYRLSMKGAHMDLQVGAEQLREFMPVSDASPTVETLEFIAREANSDVRFGMRTVESLQKNNELFAAMERLQETFFLGEYMPDVLKFPAEDRRKMLELYRKLREMQSLADLKDYESLENVVESIQTIANDFPASRILSVVRSAQRMSNLALMSLQQAVAMGDFVKAEAQMEKATAIWPLNPAIKAFTFEMANRANVETQSAGVFDQLYAREDFRQIYDRRSDLGAGLLQDAERSVLLKEVVERMGKMDILIAQAEELARQDNACAAWEILLSAYEIEPTDPNLARAQAKLAPRVADFVFALDTAKRAEEDGKFAVSLNAFLLAQDIYPASRTSDLGLERVSKKLMAEIE